MWTTSSFRAERVMLRFFTLVWLAAWIPIATAAQAQPAQSAPIPPDAPRPARPKPKEPPVPGSYEVKRSVELRSVAVRRLTEEMAVLAGAEFVKSAKDPLSIEVKTVPGVLGRPAFGASPVIVLNGERLLNTRGGGRDTLVAFLPDRTMLKDPNTVAVVWLGKYEPTLTRKPLTFRRADVKE